MSEIPKVFGTQVFHKGEQRRAVVQAPSRAAAVRAFQAAGFHNINDNYLKTYGAVTGNPAEVYAASVDPGRVYVKAGSYLSPDNGLFVPIRPIADENGENV